MKLVVSENGLKHTVNGLNKEQQKKKKKNWEWFVSNTAAHGQKQNVKSLVWGAFKNNIRTIRKQKDVQFLKNSKLKTHTPHNHFRQPVKCKSHAGKGKKDCIQLPQDFHITLQPETNSYLLHPQTNSHFFSIRYSFLRTCMQINLSLELAWKQIELNITSLTPSYLQRKVNFIQSYKLIPSLQLKVWAAIFITYVLGNKL